MGKKFQTFQLKQCTENFCMLYSTAFKTTAAHKVQTLHLCRIISWLSSILAATSQASSLRFSPCVIQNLRLPPKVAVRQLMSEVCSVTTMQDRSTSAKCLLSISTLVTQHCFHNSSSKRSLGKELNAVKLF